MKVNNNNRLVLVFCGLVAVSSALAQDTAKKSAIPDVAAQAKATKLVKEVYGDEYSKAKTAAEKQTLAKKLIDKAGETKDDAASQYVLLRLARDIALQAEDGQTAFRAIDAIAESFQVDALEMKMAVLTGLTAAAQKAEQHASIAGEALNLMDLAVGQNHFAVADQLGELALAEARRGRATELVDKAQRRLSQAAELAKAYELAKAAGAQLAKTPDDPEANLAMGKYLCLVKGDWDKGLPMLALGKDESLKALAKQELKGADLSTDQARLGDGWWDLADKQVGRAKRQIQGRAEYWYQKALPGLSGLMKAKAEKRLASVADEPSPVAESTAHRSHPPLAVAPFSENAAKQYQLQWARYVGAPVIQTNSIGMNLVLIPPGEFQMGSPKKLIDEEFRLHGGDALYRDYLSGEGPQHRVRITRPYWLGATHVTQAEYQHVMGSNPSTFQGDPKRPVEQVSWDDAVEFCQKLSELPEEKAAKRRYGLPTEAQWEHACRAGSAGRWCFSAPGKTLRAAVEEKPVQEYAWINTNSGNYTHPEAQKRPNAWGLYDMHGNVWDFCQDWYDKDYYAKSATDDPAGPSGGSVRVRRGGCWGNEARYCRSATRANSAPGARGNYQGFRVALVIADE